MSPQIVKSLNFVIRFCGRKLSQYRTFFIVFIMEGLIFLPCLLESLPCFGSEIVFEVPHSNLVMQKEISEEFMNRVLPLVDIKQDVVKRMPELCGGFVKGDCFMGFPVSVFGEEMANDQGNKYPKESTECIFPYTKHFSFLLGLITGTNYMVFNLSFHISTYNDQAKGRDGFMPRPS